MLSDCSVKCEEGGLGADKDLPKDAFEDLRL